MMLNFRILLWTKKNRRCVAKFQIIFLWIVPALTYTVSFINSHCLKECKCTLNFVTAPNVSSNCPSDKGKHFNLNANATAGFLYRKYNNLRGFHYSMMESNFSNKLLWCFKTSMVSPICGEVDPSPYAFFCTIFNTAIQFFQVAAMSCLV